MGGGTGRLTGWPDWPMRLSLLAMTGSQGAGRQEGAVAGADEVFRAQPEHGQSDVHVILFLNKYGEWPVKGTLEGTY